MRFSIIVPAYNVAPYIEEALNSALAQTCGDWECICVDDGSTDGTAQALDAFAVKDGRFKVVHKQNQGVSAARNDALAMVQGDWIAYLDGDDIWDEKFLQVASEMMVKYPKADMIVFGQSIFVDGTHNYQPRAFVPADVCVDTNQKLPDGIFNTGFFQAVYRRTTLGSVRFPHYTIGEDRVYTFRCLKLARAVAEHPMTVYHYRLRGTSAMHSRQSFKKRYHLLWASIDVAWLSFCVKMCFRLRLRSIRAVQIALFGLIKG